MLLWVILLPEKVVDGRGSDGQDEDEDDDGVDGSGGAGGGWWFLWQRWWQRTWPSVAAEDVNGDGGVLVG